MTVRLYQSTDAGAPVLAYNVAGSLIAVLDACLVNGYGSKAGAGWTKPFSGTNLAVYRQGAGGMQYLDVSDTLASSNSYALVRAYDTMTAVGTGTDPYPTTAQSAGLYFNKATATSASTWTVVADERGFYLFVQSGIYGELNYFGDLKTNDGSDSYATAIVASLGALNSASTNSVGGRVGTTVASLLSGHYMRRSYDAAIKSIMFGKHTDSAKNSAAAIIGNGGLSYPNQTDGGAYFAPLWVNESNNGTYIRGTMPGLWCPLNPAPSYVNNSTLAISAGDLAGRTLLFLTPCSSSSGLAAIEISNTWR